MPWITRDGRPQFVGGWGGLSDGERWQAIHNLNASREQERQVTPYKSSELTMRLRLENYGYFALIKHSESNFSIDIESKDLQIVYALKFNKNQIFSIIDEVEQATVGPKQELHPKEMATKLEQDRDSFLLQIELESVSALLPFQNMNDVVYFQEELKKISSWTRDNSSLVPQKLLDYLSQSDDNSISAEIIAFIKDGYPKEKLGFTGTVDFSSMARQFWAKKGLDRNDFYRYPELVRTRIDSAEALARQEMTKLVFLNKLEQFESLISDGTKYAGEIGKATIRLKDLDPLLDKRKLYLNTKMKQLLFAVINDRLLAAHPQS